MLIALRTVWFILNHAEFCEAVICFPCTFALLRLKRCNLILLITLHSNISLCHRELTSRSDLYLLTTFRSFKLDIVSKGKHSIDRKWNTWNTFLFIPISCKTINTRKNWINEMKIKIEMNYKLWSNVDNSTMLHCISVWLRYSNIYVLGHLSPLGDRMKSFSSD